MHYLEEFASNDKLSTDFTATTCVKSAVFFIKPASKNSSAGLALEWNRVDILQESILFQSIDLKEVIIKVN